VQERGSASPLKLFEKYLQKPISKTDATILAASAPEKMEIRTSPVHASNILVQRTAAAR
jgi:hypothetical protein